VDCIFCKIVAGEIDAYKVHESEHTLAFLDILPLFPGHTLLIPKVHFDTLTDLPPELVEPLFSDAQRLAGAIEGAMESHGTLILMNNRVSQSVPHLHVHVVPRRFKDGLRGFLWPRGRYSGDEAEVVAAKIRAALGARNG
jgi:histidine triad (HIT) family protein